MLYLSLWKPIYTRGFKKSICFGVLQIKTQIAAHEIMQNEFRMFQSLLNVVKY
jgi:hypothetical protein